MLKEKIRWALIFISFFLLIYATNLQAFSYLESDPWSFIPNDLAPLKESLTKMKIQPGPDVHLSEVLKKYYGRPVVESVLKIISPEYLPFFARPEVLCRPNEFMNFINSYPDHLSNQSYENILDLFRKQLGKTIVYRGLEISSSKQAFEQLLKNGLGKRGKDTVTNFGKEAFDHVNDVSKASPFQSFSEYFFISSDFIHFKDDAIFMLKVDEFDLIRKPHLFGQSIPLAQRNLAWESKIVNRDDPLVEFLTYKRHDSQEIIAAFSKHGVLRWSKDNTKFKDISIEAKSLNNFIEEQGDAGRLIQWANGIDVPFDEKWNILESDWGYRKKYSLDELNTKKQKIEQLLSANKCSNQFKSLFKGNVLTE
ncbi:MAG: hypothetical protein ACXVLQ_19065 [Bacteriovorax sp.]